MSTKKIIFLLFFIFSSSLTVFASDDEQAFEERKWKGKEKCSWSDEEKVQESLFCGDSEEDISATYQKFLEEEATMSRSSSSSSPYSSSSASSSFIDFLQEDEKERKEKVDCISASEALVKEAEAILSFYNHNMNSEELSSLPPQDGSIPSVRLLDVEWVNLPWNEEGENSLYDPSSSRRFAPSSTSSSSTSSTSFTTSSSTSSSYSLERPSDEFPGPPFKKQRLCYEEEEEDLQLAIALSLGETVYPDEDKEEKEKPEKEEEEEEEEMSLSQD